MITPRAELSFSVPCSHSVGALGSDDELSCFSSHYRGQTPVVPEDYLSDIPRIEIDAIRHSISHDPRFIVSPENDPSAPLIGTGITLADMDEANMILSPVERIVTPGENPLSDDGSPEHQPMARPNSFQISPPKFEKHEPHDGAAHKRSRSVPPNALRSTTSAPSPGSFEKQAISELLEQRRSSLTAMLQLQKSQSAPTEKKINKNGRSKSAINPFQPPPSHNKILNLRILLPEFHEKTASTLELNGPVTGEALIGRVIQTWNAQGKFVDGWVPLKSSRPVDYELRIVDEEDDEVDEDFPPLQRTKDVHSFNLRVIGMCHRRRRSISVPVQEHNAPVLEQMEETCSSPNTRRRRLISTGHLTCFVTVDVPNIDCFHLNIDQQRTMMDLLEAINIRSRQPFDPERHEFYYRHDPHTPLPYHHTVHDLVTHDTLLLPRRDFHEPQSPKQIGRRYEEYRITDMSDPRRNVRVMGFNDQQILCCHQQRVENATTLTPNFTYVWHKRGHSEERLKRKHRWVMTATLSQQSTRQWTTQRVKHWLMTVQGGRFQYFADTFAALQVNGQCLLDLTEEDLGAQLGVHDIEDRQDLHQYIQRLQPQMEHENHPAEAFHTTPIQCLRSITQCPSMPDVFELEFELEGDVLHTSTYQATSPHECECIVSRIASLLQLERAREMDLSVSLAFEESHVTG